MKYIFGIIILAAVVYNISSRLNGPVGRQSLSDETAASPEPEPLPSAVISPPPVIPEPPPELPAPEKHLAPEGVFYVLQRLSITTDSGVVGVPPGAKVTLVKAGKPMRVTDGRHEFEVGASQVTNDLDVAAQVYQMESEQRAAVAAATEAQVEIGQKQELNQRTEATASTEAAGKKLDQQAQLLRQQMEAAAIANAQKQAPERVVKQATPYPVPMQFQRR